MSQRYQEIMVDIETLSSESNALMVSLGAITRNQQGDLIRFEAVVAPNHYSNKLDISPDTVNWWLKQSEEARASITKPGRSLVEVCAGFNQWLESICPPDAKPRLWGNGAAFDNVILRANYKVAGMKPAWGFREDACYRTLKNLLPDTPWTPPAIAHSAISDAEAQFIHLEALLARISHGKQQ